MGRSDQAIDASVQIACFICILISQQIVGISQGIGSGSDTGTYQHLGDQLHSVTPIGSSSGSWNFGPERSVPVIHNAPSELSVRSMFVSATGGIWGLVVDIGLVQRGRV